MGTIVVDKRSGLIERYFESIGKSYYEVSEKPDLRTRLIWRDGRIEPAPTIRLEITGPCVVGVPVIMAVTLPDTSVPSPERFELLINDQTIRWDAARRIQFDYEGDYCIKVTGPAPWASNQARFAVSAAPAETIEGGTESRKNEPVVG